MNDVMKHQIFNLLFAVDENGLPDWSARTEAARLALKAYPADHEVLERVEKSLVTIMRDATRLDVKAPRWGKPGWTEVDLPDNATRLKAFKVAAELLRRRQGRAKPQSSR